MKAMLIQEEGRLGKMKDQSVHLVGHDGASSSKRKPGKKDKKKDKAPKGPDSNIRKEMKCFFCKKSGHFKKECPKGRHGLKRKVCIIVMFVLNQTLWKCLIILGGWILVLLLMCLM